MYVCAGVAVAGELTSSAASATDADAGKTADDEEDPNVGIANNVTEEAQRKLIAELASGAISAPEGTNVPPGAAGKPDDAVKEDGIGYGVYTVVCRVVRKVQRAQYNYLL